MSYDDTSCPCGGKKEHETMLCSGCVKAFERRPELRGYMDRSQPIDFRRNDALILLALSRRRGEHLVRCNVCVGSGREPNSRGQEECRYCAGTGRRELQPPRGAEPPELRRAS